MALIRTDYVVAPHDLKIGLGLPGVPSSARAARFYALIILCLIAKNRLKSFKTELGFFVRIRPNPQQAYESK